MSTTVRPSSSSEEASSRILINEDEERTEVTEEKISKVAVTKDEAAGTVTMHKTTFAVPGVTPPAECTEDR